MLTYIFFYFFLPQCINNSHKFEFKSACIYIFCHICKFFIGNSLKKKHLLVSESYCTIAIVLFIYVIMKIHALFPVHILVTSTIFVPVLL